MGINLFEYIVGISKVNSKVIALDWSSLCECERKPCQVQLAGRYQRYKYRQGEGKQWHTIQPDYSLLPVMTDWLN